jgi:hypothetical protein
MTIWGKIERVAGQWEEGYPKRAGVKNLIALISVFTGHSFHGALWPCDSVPGLSSFAPRHCSHMKINSLEDPP